MAEKLYATAILVLIAAVILSLPVSYLADRKQPWLWIFPGLLGVAAFVLFIMSIWSY